MINKFVFQSGFSITLRPSTLSLYLVIPADVLPNSNGLMQIKLFFSGLEEIPIWVDTVEAKSFCEFLDNILKENDKHYSGFVEDC
jgi:hypothetical protein